MALVALIIDSRPDYLCRAGSSLSLLSLPLGTGTVLGTLLARIREIDGTQVWILPAGLNDATYKQAIRDSGGGEVVSPEQLTAALHRYEPSDVVAVMDPRYWPASGFDLAALLEQRPDNRWAVHAVSLGEDVEGSLEDVRCDSAGYVQRVRRYYDLVTWPKTGPIWASVLSVSAIEDVSFSSPRELRAVLAAKGILSLDASVSSSSTDLSDEQGMLALSEAVVIEQAVESPPQGYFRWSEEVLVGADCRIHPSARLMGPVIVQSGAIIDEGATVIGPTVVGAGCRLQRGSLVAQCLVAPNRTVKPGLALLQQVVAGNGSAKRNQRPGREGKKATAGRLGRPHRVYREPALADIRDATDGRRFFMAAKLICDTVLAGLALLLLAPLFAAIALAVRLGSRGAVLYHDNREGKDGRVFRCLKFRTMEQDAHEKQREMYADSAVDGPQFKLDDDPRVTRVGRWLRSTNLDELPQLFNVFIGQMSLVGPRPSPFRENQICVPWRRARLSVRPGITGLWQVCRHNRDQGDFHQWIAYDIAYVRNMSLKLDFKILLVTVITLGGRWYLPEAWILGKRRHRRTGPL